MPLPILKIYLIGIFCILLISVIGRIVVRLDHLNLRWPAVIFLQFTTTLLAIVFVFSVWITRGITVNVIIGVFLLIYLYANRKHIHSMKSAGKLTSLGIPLFLFSVFFLVKYFAFYNFKYDLPNIPHNDILYYTTISDFIGETGQENLSNFRNIVSPSAFNGLNPYHFLEMWISALWSRAFDINSLWSFVLVTHSILLMVTALGFYALIDHFFLRGNRYVILLLSLGSVLYAGLPTNFPKMNIAIYNGIILPKLLLIYLFVLIFALFFLAGELWIAIAVLVVLAWINTAAAPGIYIGLFMFACLKLILEREGKIAVKIMLAIGLSALCYSAFVIVFKSGNSHLESGIISLNTLLGACKTWTVQGLLLIINYFVILIPFLWILKGRIRLNTFINDPVLQMILILVFIMIGGILFSGVFHSVVSSQFAYNLYIPIMAVVTVLIAVLLSRAEVPRVLFYFVCVISFVIIMDACFTFKSNLFSKPERIERYSEDYIRESSAILQRCSNDLGIFIAEPAFFEGSDLNKLEDYHYLGKYLKAYRSKLYLANYWPDKINVQNSILERNYSHGSVLVQYAQRKGSEMKMDSARLLFVEEYKPGFLLVQGEHFPPLELKKWVRDSATDNQSHEKFYRLEYSSLR